MREAVASKLISSPSPKIGQASKDHDTEEISDSDEDQ